MNTLKVIYSGIYNSDINSKGITLSKERTTTMFELEVPTEDGGFSYLEGKGTKIETNTVMFFKPGQNRNTLFPLKTYYLHFKVDKGSFFDTLSQIPTYISKVSSEKYYSLFRKLLSYTKLSRPADELMYRSICLEIISTLCTDYERLLCREKAKSYSYKAVESAIKYIENNLSADLSLPAVSEYAKYSPFHFHKCFKQYTSMTLREFVEEKRFEKAIELLTTTTKTLTEISYDCGFSSQAYFSYSFKKKTGLTPREYANEIFRQYEIQKEH